MTLDIQRSYTEPFDNVALTWKPVTQKDVLDTATVVCARGHSGLIDEHRIASDGTVSPSLVCTQNGCDWHIWVILRDWENRWNG